MIARIVKMTFKHHEVDNFLILFNEKKKLIRNFEGCVHLQLLQDELDIRIIYTYSNWLSKAHLEKYRTSELFATTWRETKALFDDKPIAYSLDELQNVEK
jgi:quinol monooxygenase YgiN